ncbi:MFS allantoate transporter [Penicillium verhagenii]|nr:MFS allantoate transporter [Penicillium verhagenii]
MKTDERDSPSVDQLENARPTPIIIPTEIVDKIHNGDDALQFLQQGHEPYSKEEEKRVLRKVDIRMLTLMVIVNGFQFVDKNTLSYAGTYGLETEAHLVGQQYSLLTTIFYIGYLAAQWPANWLMQRFPISKVLCITFVLWGATLTATGACTTFRSLATVRLLLGIFESALNPGFVLITSSWWKREEQPARVGLWYSANGLIGAPSGAIFYGIAHLHARGLFAYQWMFIIFGSVTVCFGISLWWLLPSTPMTAGFLTERERFIVVDRLKSNKTGVKNSNVKGEQFKETLLDIRVWMLVLAIFCHNMTNSLQTTFMGIIIKGFGYNTYEAVLLNIPPGIIMAASMILVSLFLSSKWGKDKRIFCMLLCYIPGIISASILYCSPIEASTKHLHLFAIFIVPIVATSAGIMYSLLASNVAGYSKKVMVGAMFFSSNCLANIISPQTFITAEAPTYTTGMVTSLCMFVACILIFSILYILYSLENKKRELEDVAEMTEEMELANAFADLTDRQNISFRYTL